jgi:hypothetical protein
VCCIHSTLLFRIFVCVCVCVSLSLSLSLYIFVSPRDPKKFLAYIGRPCMFYLVIFLSPKTKGLFLSFLGGHYSKLILPTWSCCWCRRRICVKHIAHVTCVTRGARLVALPLIASNQPNNSFTMISMLHFG